MPLFFSLFLFLFLLLPSARPTRIPVTRTRSSDDCTSILEGIDDDEGGFWIKTKACAASAEYLSDSDTLQVRREFSLSRVARNILDPAITDSSSLAEKYTKLFLILIPKTGSRHLSSIVRRVLCPNFEAGAPCRAYSEFHVLPNPDAILASKPEKDIPCPTIATRHAVDDATSWRTFVDATLPSLGAQSVTLVRNPVERTLSEFCHRATNRPKWSDSVDVWEDLRHFVESDYMRNFQVAVLVGKRVDNTFADAANLPSLRCSEGPATAATREDLDFLLNLAMHGKMLLGTTEAYENSIRYFGNILGWQTNIFDDYDFSPRKRKNDESENRLRAVDVPPDILELISKTNELDRELWAAASSYAAKEIENQY